MSIVAGEEILIVNNTLTITGTEASINSTTGALVVTNGGVGLKENLNIQSNYQSDGNVNVESVLTVGTGTSGYVFPIEGGSSTEVLIFTTSNALIFGSIEEPNQVTTLSFGVNNALLKSLGTAKDIEATGIIIGNNDDMSGVNTLSVDGTSTFSGSIKIESNASSSSNTTGALTIVGGVAIGENINVTGNLNINGNANLNDKLNLSVGTSGYYFPTETGTSNQILVVGTDGGLIFDDQLVSSTQVYAPSPFGIDNLMLKTQGIDRDVEATSVTISDTDGVSGVGSLSVDSSGNIGGHTTITNATSSINTTTGAAIVSGGIGVAENLNVGGNLNVSGTLDVATFKIGIGATEYSFPSSEGNENDILVISSSGGLVYEQPTVHPDRVESTSEFGTDNRLIKSDGTDRNTEATGIIISDNDDMSGVNSINVTNNSTINGTLAVTSGTSSTDTSTGALIVLGGVGISENLNIGGNLTTSNIININNTTGSVSNNTGALTVVGGVGINGDVNISGTISVDNLILGTQDINLNSTTNSISNTTGAIIVYGGVGIEGNVNIGGELKVDSTSNFNGVISITDTTESGDSTSGALIVDGGIGIDKNLNVGGFTNIESTLESNTNTDGALVIDGGIGINKSIFVGGSYSGDSITIRDTTNATDTSTGALLVSGGMSIDKDLYAAGLFATNPIVTNSKFFMAVHTGTVSSASTTFVQLTWDTEIRNDTALFTHAANSANIDVVESGWYEITTEVTSQIEAGDGNIRTISSVRLTVDSSPIAASTSYIMNRTAERGHGTTNITTIANLTAGNTINVEINRLLGTSTITTVANGCRLYISRI